MERPGTSGGEEWEISINLQTDHTHSLPVGQSGDEERPNKSLKAFDGPNWEEWMEVGEKEKKCCCAALEWRHLTQGGKKKNE